MRPVFCFLYGRRLDASHRDGLWAFASSNSACNSRILRSNSSLYSEVRSIGCDPSTSPVLRRRPVLTSLSRALKCLQVALSHMDSRMLMSLHSGNSRAVRTATSATAYGAAPLATPSAKIAIAFNTVNRRHPPHRHSGPFPARHRAIF
jgi:hypothetical protein